jgi:RiboL-PSP-HEPN
VGGGGVTQLIGAKLPEQPVVTAISQAAATFEVSIKDAKALLAFHAASGRPPPPEAEVLKRAGLVMALTAWETYVEDRVQEAVNLRFGTDSSHAARFMLVKLREELKRLHNPTSDKTRKLFDDYLGVDVTTEWNWQHMDPNKACAKLDLLMKKRGDAVHRARPSQSGPTPPHLVNRDELEKAIRFIRELVAATERAMKSDGR